MTSIPLVSCIMPTHNRRHFVSQSIWYFLRQNYTSKELIIVDDGEDAIADIVPNDERIHYIRLEEIQPLGTKRNIACQHSRGELIAHWDDDDWMSFERLSIQIDRLQATDTDVCGASQLLYYRVYAEEAWHYSHPDNTHPWLAGGTLLYRRSLWEQNHFPAINVGENTAFIQQVPTEKLLSIKDFYCYISVIHEANNNTKNLASSAWHQLPLDEVTSRLGCVHRDFYSTLREDFTPEYLKTLQNLGLDKIEIHIDSDKLPTVTCIMPTYNRRRFVPQAIAYFQRQTYPNRELLILDDGTDSVADLIPEDPSIRYVRLDDKHSIGVKRNLGCQMAQGEIIMFWDDDDWYADNRIAHQIEALVANEVGVTAMGNSPFFCIDSDRFWTCTPQLWDYMFYQGVHGGTLSFWKQYWQKGARFPDSSLGEDAAFLRILLSNGVRLGKLKNHDVFFYIRHTTNAWSFKTGGYFEPSEWRHVDTPDFITESDLAFYRS